MGSQKILIAGPASAQVFLEKLASAVASDEARVDLQFGLASPADAPGWRETQIFLSFGVPCGRTHMDAAPAITTLVTPSSSVM